MSEVDVAEPPSDLATVGSPGQRDIKTDIDWLDGTPSPRPSRRQLLIQGCRLTALVEAGDLHLVTIGANGHDWTFRALVERGREIPVGRQVCVLWLDIRRIRLVAAPAEAS